MLWIPGRPLKFEDSSLEIGVQARRAFKAVNFKLATGNKLD